MITDSPRDRAKGNAGGGAKGVSLGVPLVLGDPALISQRAWRWQ